MQGRDDDGEKIMREGKITVKKGRKMRRRASDSWCRTPILRELTQCPVECVVI
jgi:hypothetical protein